MKRNRPLDKNERLYKLPLSKILITVGIIVFVGSFLISNYLPNIDLLTLLVFLVPGSMTLIWGLMYLIALFIGFGLTNTATPGSRILNTIELVRPEYSILIEKVILGIITLMLFMISFVCFLLVYLFL